MNDIAKVTSNYATEKAFLKTHFHPQIEKDRNHLYLIVSLANTNRNDANSIFKPNHLRMKRSRKQFPLGNGIENTTLP